MALVLRNLILFLKRKLFLYFGKRKPQKNYLYFRKWNFLIIQETSYISGSNFLSSKNDKRSGNNLQRLKNKKKIVFCLLRANFLNISAKKVYYTFPYKEVNFSKLKYFLIIIINCFFLNL